MQNGKITQAGKYDELLQAGTGFETLVSAHNHALDSIVTVENLSAKGLLQISDGNPMGHSDEKSSDQVNTRVKTVHIQNSQNKCTMQYNRNLMGIHSVDSYSLHKMRRENQKVLTKRFTGLT